MGFAALPPLLIRLSIDWFKVGWIDANLNPAEMVKLLSLRNWPDEK
jgi:hypothetical protein